MREQHIRTEKAPLSKWGLLKARVVDHVQKHEEKKTEESSIAKSAKAQKKKEVAVKPTTKKELPQSNRPIEQVLVGSWNALKNVPERQGKGVLNLYDKLRFSTLTSEEQKVKDKTHVFLKKYQKEIGWGVTGVEAAVLTVGVAKGFTYLKEKMASRPERARRALSKRLKDVGGITAVPIAVEVALTLEQKALQSLLNKVNSPYFFKPELLSPNDNEILAKSYFSKELRQQIHEGVLERFIQRIPGVENQHKGSTSNTLRRAVFDGAMIRAGADFGAAQRGLSGKEFHLGKMRAEGNPFIDILDYVRVMRHAAEKNGLFDIGGMNGGQIEDLIPHKK